MRVPIPGACLCLLIASVGPLHAQVPSYTKDVRPFLNKYCVECHQGSKVVVYSVRMAGRPECVSGLLPHFAQGKAACASQVGFARELSFVGTVSWTLLTVRCRRDWHDFVENGLGGRLQLHFLQQLGEATLARLPPTGDLFHDTGEREFRQVET
jgi:hypothetical protein